MVGARLSSFALSFGERGAKMGDLGLDVSDFSSKVRDDVRVGRRERSLGRGCYSDSINAAI